MALFGKKTEDSARQELQELKREIKKEKRKDPMLEALNQRMQEAKEREEQISREASSIVMSTGDIRGDYDIIESLIVVEDLTNGSGAIVISPDKAFIKLKQTLKQQCMALGGDAVIYCSFHFGASLTIAYAYGTAVRMS